MTALEILQRDGDFRNVALRPLPTPVVDEEACRCAMNSARAAAELLRTKFGVSKVVLFGSLATREWFSERSDIDLAVYGLPDELFFRACASVSDLEAKHEINLVDGADIPEGMRGDIERDGIEL